MFGHDNVLIAGAEFTRHDVTSRTFQESQESRSLEASLADEQDAAGVYLQDSLAVARGFAGPRSSVVLTAAGRWDLLRHRIDDRLGGPSGGTHTFQRVNPRAGINVNLTEHVGAFVSYGEGFRAPAFLELTCAGPGAVCPGLQVGVAPDPPLKAVKARTYEAGVYARPVAWLDLSATAYRSDVQDDIFAVAPTGTTGVFFQNIGSTRRQGIEASARGRAGRALDLYLNYAYTEATFEDRVDLATPLPPGSQTVAAGRSFALVPRHRVNAGLDLPPLALARPEPRRALRELPVPARRRGEPPGAPAGVLGHGRRDHDQASRRRGLPEGQQRARQPVRDLRDLRAQCPGRPGPRSSAF